MVPQEIQFPESHAKEREWWNPGDPIEKEELEKKRLPQSDNLSGHLAGETGAETKESVMGSI